MIFFYVLEHKCDLYNYADDNTISYHHQNLQTVKNNLETSAKIGGKWFVDNQMKVNTDKFQALLLCPGMACSSEEFCFEIDGVKIRPDKSVKLLGVLYR